MSGSPAAEGTLQVDLVDGTYELFRHFYGLRRFRKDDPPLGAVLGVVRTILLMLEEGSTHVGVATDHVIESFRNELWAEYKTGAGIERALWAQFHPLEEALDALGVAVWAMVEYEADDALAAAAHRAAADARVARVRIWTPDKDLAQSVSGTRIVQVDRKSNAVRDEDEVVKKFGVRPALIADYLALVGDSADGYPGIAGIGPTTARRLLNRYGPIESLPDDRLADQRERALLFKLLATLRTEAPVFNELDDLEWRGPRPEFGAWATKLGDEKLVARCEKLLRKRQLQ
jgi:5'-3' exonuclease